MEPETWVAVLKRIVLMKPTQTESSRCFSNHKYDFSLATNIPTMLSHSVCLVEPSKSNTLSSTNDGFSPSYVSADAD